MSSSYSNKRTRENVLIAIFAAIIILQTWVPFLGYIALPTLSLTIIHITVIVVTLLKGTKAGRYHWSSLGNKQPPTRRLHRKPNRAYDLHEPAHQHLTPHANALSHRIIK